MFLYHSIIHHNNHNLQCSSVHFYFKRGFVSNLVHYIVSQFVDFQTGFYIVFDH